MKCLAKSAFIVTGLMSATPVLIVVISIEALAKDNPAYEKRIIRRTYIEMLRRSFMQKYTAEDLASRFDELFDELLREMYPHTWYEVNKSR